MNIPTNKNVMDDDETLALVISLIVDQVGVKPETVSSTTRFVEDLGFDSLDDVEFVMDLEDSFGVALTDEECEKLKTVGDVAKHLAQGAR